MEFRVLGPVSAMVGDRPLPIGGPKSRAVLALLLLRAGRVMTTDQLVDALWGDQPPATAVETLRAYVSRLKRVLADEADVRPRLRSEGTGYGIRVEPGELDARTFQTAALAGRRLVNEGEWAAAAHDLRTALALWRGPALAGLERFEVLAAEAERLEEMRLQAVEDRVEADIALGRHAEAITELEALVASHPFRERVWGQLMLALYRSGRQADALGTYQRARRMLVEELGVEPGPELRALELAIIRQDATLTLPGTRSASSPRLPAERSSFVGRGREMEHLDRLLVESRAVTMTGIGGAGKTRLALRATHDAAPRYPDGVWWVELASVTDPQLVAQQAAAALGVSASESRRRSIAEVLVDYLADQAGLLVLDNCEHLVAAAAELADAVLTHCPAMRVLATSRESLGVPGEVTVPVQPLDVPPPGADSPEGYASVRLFLDRSGAAAPGFSADADDLEQIAEICRRLEGIPLAIELAAARAKLLSPAEIASRLEGRLDLLAGGPRTALPRHRSLRATLDWSFDLLDPGEQWLLRQASVFVGGFTVDSAIGVAAGHQGGAGREGEQDAADATLDRLAGLVERSLVETDRGGRGTRYRLLEPVRQYAAQRLTSEGEPEATRLRHATWFLRLAEQADGQLRGSAQSAWLATLDAEHANLRAALGWALETHRADLALRLTAALGWYWFMRGHWVESRRWLDRALAVPGGAPLLRAQAIARAGAVDIIRVNLGTMPALVEEALETCRRGGDERGVAWCLHLLGHAALYQPSSQDRARSLLQAGLDAFVALGDEWGTAWSLRYLASSQQVGEDPDAMLATERDAAERFRALGDLWSTAFSLYGIGQTLLFGDRRAEARSTFAEAMELCRALDDQVMAAHSMRGLAMLTLLEGDLETADGLFTKARTIFHRAGDENCHGSCSMNLAIIHLARRETAAARQELELALASFRSIGRDDTIGLAIAWLATADALDGNPRRAAVLMAASRWSDGLTPGVLLPGIRARLEAHQAEIRHQMRPGPFRQACAEGEQLSRDEAIRLVLGRSMPMPARTAGPPDPL